ncbi:hypothetical protein ACSBR2_015341 [Camellia fascicularis]
MAAFPAIFRSLTRSSSPKSFFLTITKFSNSFLGLASICTKSNFFSCSSVLSHHLKNQNLDEARFIFDKIPFPSVHLCTKMITGYAENCRLDDALKLFYKMLVRDTVCWNSMIKGCLSCRNLNMSRKLFDEMPERNVVSWTTMINGYLQFGRIEVAECLFREMPMRDIAAWNSMIYGYFCNGRVDDAMKLFEGMPCRNVISWTSMINGLDQHGKTNEALFLFQQMVVSGVEPTSSTFSTVITACANVSHSQLGVQVHALVVMLGYSFDAFVTASLVTFYANCKQIDNCCKVFNEKLHINVVVWTALLTGYGLNHKHEDALKVFSDMIKLGILPNQSSFTSALNSCCELEALDRGKEIHATAIKLCLETDAFVANSLIVLYSKCGNIKTGVVIFKNIGEKNIVSWNSIIVGCARHGYGMWALAFFTQIIRVGVDPDEITFTGLLSSCSRSGMLQKGRCLFEYFSQCKAIDMKLEHYACMVDILGRSGRLEEAEELVKNMPMKANTMVWLALLSACRMHFDFELAEKSAHCIFDLEPDCSAAYVLLSNLYASAGRWNDVARIRVKMKGRGIKKQPGQSWLTLKGQRHVFLSGDRSHPSCEKIYKKLEWLGEKLKEIGYVPDQRFALHDVEDEQKDVMLSYHSERLAIGFGLISTVEGSTITVMKNLRVCGDCHSAIKLMAKIVGREIIVRDSSRFHHFRNGFCSCGDYCGENAKSQIGGTFTSIAYRTVAKAVKVKFGEATAGVWASGIKVKTKHVRFILHMMKIMNKYVEHSENSIQLEVTLQVQSKGSFLDSFEFGVNANKLEDVLKLEADLDAVAQARDHGNPQDYDDQKLYDEIEKVGGMNETSQMKVYQGLYSLGGSRRCRVIQAFRLFCGAIAAWVEVLMQDENGNVMCAGIFFG